jgi:hypothetical protein
VKLFRDVSGLRCSLFAAAALAVAGCSSGSSMPPVSGNAMPVGPSTVTTTSSDRQNDAVTTFSSNPCAHPKFPTVCVQQGNYSTLGIQENCGKSTRACGSVHWSTKTSSKEISAYFQPNPGNPSSEVVSAFIKMKVGRYTQTIKITCSKDKDCVKYPLKATIYVLKYGGGKE